MAAKTASRRPTSSLASIKREAASCRRCPLWRHATQVVFGEGSARAEVMLVGEQPGDVEDLKGAPFVGPAGQLLRDVLEEVGITVKHTYVTNAVKHFKWTPRGKRRIHERPNRDEILACRMWLEEEIAHVRPRIIVGLGATAASSLLGSSVRVTRDRGRRLPSQLADIVTVTVHPSSILRAPDARSRADARASFVADLRQVAMWLDPH